MNDVVGAVDGDGVRSTEDAARGGKRAWKMVRSSRRDAWSNATRDEATFG